MSETKIAIIGAGPGGYVAAIRAAQLGAKVTVIEDIEVGGTCLNRGCIPTKTLVATTEVYEKVKEAASFGIDIEGGAKVNVPKIMERQGKVIGTLVKGIRGLFKMHGITLIEGRGAFVDGKTIEVTPKGGGDKVTVTADKIIIATGSRPAEIPTFKFDREKIISSDDAICFGAVPRRILIVGAGVIGCEFACVFKGLGAEEVTMVELLPRCLSTEDPEISEMMARELKKKKIKLITNAKIEKVTVNADGTVTSSMEGGAEVVSDQVLVSIGRALNVEGLGLDKAGVQQGKRGEILVNEFLETNVPGVYAIGDVIGGIMLAHVASAEGITAVENILHGNVRKMDYRVVPAGIFTIPEIGSVGLREHEAEAKGIKVKIGRFQLRGLGKAQAMNELAGMVKVIADAETDKVLGVHIMGAHSTDYIHEGALAIAMGATAKQVAEMIHSHPTLAESVMEAMEDVHGMAVHVPPAK
ncbi:MAG: dihydrolipoyl dehydrogenase [Nitrospirae bacterium]|nr:dihydrolipoyl dehydrogenase [Nitrospirota bacterium]MBI5694611.1 dihydrolipoyl dehydrogenase [Nitrospirota bacterium]